jgi:WD40 repeat protein
VAPHKPGEIRLWDTTTGQQLASWTAHRGNVRCVTWSPDGKGLASSGDDKTIKLWKRGTGQEEATLEGHTECVNSVVFSPDGKTLASASGGADQNGQPLGGEVKLWNAVTRQVRATLKGHKSNVSCVVFSPDGKTLASASSDRMVKLWDVATEQELATFKGHVGGVSFVCFSPDGKTLASGDGDGTIKLWDVPSSPRADQAAAPR